MLSLGYDEHDLEILYSLMFNDFEIEEISFSNETITFVNREIDLKIVMSELSED